MKFYIISFICLLFTFSCRKAVEVDPPVTSLVSATVFNNNSTASAAVTGIYINMISYSSVFGGGAAGLSILLGLSADELNYYGTGALQTQIYQNAQVGTNPPAIWGPLYNYIYQANAAIEGLAGATAVTPALKQQLTGEAKFIRAFCYFYLVNLYGDVPLATTTDYKTNTAAARAGTTTVYQQIVTDLKDAQGELSDNFLDPAGNVTSERVRPNKAAATALLARTYLYQKDWQDAEAQATAVINESGTYSLLSDLDGVFLANSNEAIWQLQAITPGYNTQDGYTLILTQAPGGGFGFALNPDLLGAFEPDDQRRLHWVDSISAGGTNYYYPYKYKVQQSTTVSEYTMVLRLAEQFLIRSEARAMQSNLTGAIMDINVIRDRAGLSPLMTSLGQAQVIAAVAHERQTELFTEWGHRWLDLIRMGTIDQTMDTVTVQKGGIWISNHQLFPIPIREIQVNPNLIQNPGYQ